MRRERADGAVRRGRRALDGAEIHHRLVEGGGLVFRQEGLRQRRELLLRLRGTDWRRDAVITGQDPVHIAVDDGRGQVEGDGADGGSRVIPHPFQRTDAFQRRRKAAEGNDLLGCGMQVPSPAVIAEALPEPQDLVLRGGGQVIHRRETRHEALPVGHALGDARLLEDDFAEPDGVRVPRPAPRQVTPVLPVPAEQGLGKDRIPHRSRSS